MSKRNKKRHSKSNLVERKRQHHETHAHAEAASHSAHLRYVGIALAIAGALITAYLTYNKVFGEHAAFCGEGSSCDLVQQSHWSTLFGLPLSVWGLMTYAVTIGLLFRMARKPSAWRTLWWVSAFAFVFSAYLTFISVTKIEATCGYCLASFAVLTALLAVVTLLKPAELPKFTWSSYATGSIGSALLIVFVLHLHYSGAFSASAGPEKPYLKGLAQHLVDTGAVFYGAYWCPKCQQQKAAFQASADRLPYQECTPEGRSGPRALACVNNAIQAFPTWIIDGQRYEGMLEPKALAGISKFEWSE